MSKEYRLGYQRGVLAWESGDRYTKWYPHGSSDDFRQGYVDGWCSQGYED